MSLVLLVVGARLVLLVLLSALWMVQAVLVVVLVAWAASGHMVGRAASLWSTSPAC